MRQNKANVEETGENRTDEINCEVGSTYISIHSDQLIARSANHKFKH